MSTHTEPAVAAERELVLGAGHAPDDEGDRPRAVRPRRARASRGRAAGDHGRAGARAGARVVRQPGGVVRRHRRRSFVRAFGNGLRRPKSMTIGADLAGRVEAVGKDVTEFQPGDEVFGTSGASWAEYAPAREVRLAAEAGERVVRGGGGRAHRSAHRAPGAARPRSGPAGPEGADQRRVRRCRAPTRSSSRSRSAADVTAVCSTRNVEQTRVARGGSRRRLHAGGLHAQLRMRHELMIDIAGSRPFRQFRRVLTPDATIVARRRQVPVDGSDRTPVPPDRSASRLRGQRADGQVLHRQDRRTTISASWRNSSRPGRCDR